VLVAERVDVLSGDSGQLDAVVAATRSGSLAAGIAAVAGRSQRSSFDAVARIQTSVGHAGDDADISPHSPIAPVADSAGGGTHDDAARVAGNLYARTGAVAELRGVDGLRVEAS
jgi:hypothetical protein